MLLRIFSILKIQEKINSMPIFFRSSLFKVLISALALRLIWYVCIGVEPVSDSYIYRAFAWSIAEGKGYAYPDGNLTAYWAVGPSAFYALAMYLLGDIALAALIPNIISGMLLIVFTYLVARRYFDERTASIAACLLCAWPVLIQFTTVYASEIHFSALMMWSLYALQQSKKYPTLQGLHWGAVLALASYMRPTAMPFFALFPLIHYLYSRDLRTATLSTLTAVLVAALLIAPWAYRNKTIIGQYVPISANFGSNLWMGNNPDSNGGYMPLPDAIFKNELDRDNFYKNQAIDYIKNNPLQYLKLSLKRIYMSFGRETIGIAWNEPSLNAKLGRSGVQLSKALSSIYWLALFLVSISTYFYVTWKRLLPIYSPLVVAPAVFIAIPILTVGQDRYHMALIPFVAIFAAYAVRLFKPNRFSKEPTE